MLPLPLALRIWFPLNPPSPRLRRAMRLVRRGLGVAGLEGAAKARGERPQIAQSRNAMFLATVGLLLRMVELA